MNKKIISQAVLNDAVGKL